MVNRNHHPLPVFIKVLIPSGFKFFRKNTFKSVDSAWFIGALSLDKSNTRGPNGLTLPPLFLQRYDSIVVRGWGSVNDMIRWELAVRRAGARIGKRELERDRPGWRSTNTGENSTP